MHLNFNIQIESPILKMKIIKNYDEVERIRRLVGQWVRKNREIPIVKKLL